MMSASISTAASKKENRVKTEQELRDMIVLMSDDTPQATNMNVIIVELLLDIRSILERLESGVK